ncbi:MAG: glycosyltransferase family 2 protein [Armatimonadota bacterium]|nr:glycosyltransferase family 2 protein [Armatimonadota bacterium]MDW8143662.1 glycosyltransferase family 2 protein [Armatimonadota bacterium]
MSDLPLLSIVIVSWNVREDLRECLQSLLGTGDRGLGSGKLDFEVIVVDNASSDGTAEMVKREFPQVKLIVNEENLGFTKANNIGIRQSRGKYILLLNPDTIVKPNALRALVECAEAHPDAGIIGAKLLNPDGSIQRSARSFPDIGAGLFRNTFLGRLFPNNPFVRRYLLTDFSYDEVREVDWVSGAAMLVRREVFERIGLLDESFWAYCEDVDLCWRAWQAGFKVLFCPSAVIVHKIGRSSDQRLVPSLIQHHRSMWLFYLKNYRKRYPLILFPLIGLGILMRLGGGLLRVCVHRLRVCCHEKLSALLGRQSTLTISEDEPSENQTLRA